MRSLLPLLLALLTFPGLARAAQDEDTPKGSEPGPDGGEDDDTDQESEQPPEAPQPDEGPPPATQTDPPATQTGPPPATQTDPPATQTDPSATSGISEDAAQRSDVTSPADEQADATAPHSSVNLRLEKWDHPLRVDLKLEIPLVVGVSVPYAFLFFAVEGEGVGYLPDRSAVTAFDEIALGNFRPEAAIASDVLVYSMMALPFLDHAVESAVSARDDGTHFGRRFGTDALVVFETLAITGLVTDVMKRAVARPRPLTYLDPADVGDGDLREELIEKQNRGDSGKSFPSGHASNAFAAAASWSMLWTLKHPDRPGALVAVWIGTMSAATATATLRVAAGRHFPSDVISGAALGTAIGMITPLLHRRKAGGPPIALVPLLSPDQRGLAIVGRL